MAGKLSVEFEINTSDASQRGREAGRAFSNSFRDELNKNLATGVPRELIQTLSGRGWGSGNTTRNISVNRFGGLAPALAMAMNPKVMKDFLDQTLNIKSGQNVFSGAARKSYEDFWKKAVPPFLQPGSQGGNSMRSLFLGLGAAPFSSWIGARMLSDAAFGGGKKGGGHGGLLGAGGAGGFAEFFIGIEALKKAFEYGSEKIKEVVEKGFQLYVRSGQLRRSVGELFSIQAAGEQVGLNQSQIDQFLLRNQWGKARTSLQNFGVFSQIGGLSKDFKEAYGWASEIAPIWDKTARTTFEIHNNIYRMKQDWLAMWADSSFLNALDKLSGITDKMLHAGNISGNNPFNSALQSVFPVLGSIWNAIPSIPSSSSSIPGAPDFPLKQSLPIMGAWEKMGFVIGGGKADKQDRIIGQLDMAISIWKQILQKISTGHALPTYTGTSNQNLNPP